MLRRLVLALALLPASALAGEIACPDLAAAARQVGNCATTEELKIGYAGYCSDNQRMYDKDSQTCLSLDNYKKLKDVSLWEAGEFQGYIHCSNPPEAVRAATFVEVGAKRFGSMTRVVCSYSGEMDFTYRTKAECKVEGGKAVCQE